MSHRRRLTRTIIIAAAAFAAIAASTAPPPALAAAGDFGPNTCLIGFVWRAAVPGDAVCVAPRTRQQAADDNRAAESRRDPNGAWGPNSCRTPYVWRLARPSDLVCVTVETRRQTAVDNATAASRRNSVLVTLARLSTPDTRTCDGDTCTITHDGTTTHLVKVTNINIGRAFLGLYRSSDRRLLQGWNATASPIAGRPGGRVTFKTNRLICAGEPNAYFRVKDQTSGRWSVRQFVRTGCFAL